MVDTAIKVRENVKEKVLSKNEVTMPSNDEEY